MAPNAVKAAQHASASDLRNPQPARADDSEIHQNPSWPQDRLVSVRRKNNRTRYEVRLKSFDSLRRVIVGQRDQNGVGEYRDTGPTLVVPPALLDDFIEMLCDARRAAVEEGIIV